MKRRLLLVGVLAALWLGTGLFIVRGNERAAVRRCGKGVVNADGQLVLRGSGLHWDLPWPLSVVDRVNLHEIRTLSAGATASEPVSDSAFLREFEPADRSQFLTGDKNILHVRVDVQYRVSATNAGDFLYASESPTLRLQQLTEAGLTELVTSAGVDAVHTYGRAALQQRLTAELREAAAAHRLGVEIESAVIDDVRPPIRVKAAFLDVNDARADREKFIQSGLAYEQQRQEQARGESRRIGDEAETFRDQSLASSRASAESFERLVAQLKQEAERTSDSYVDVRQRLLRRRYLDDVTQILKTVSAKVVLETGRQVDVTILRDAPK